MQIKIPATLTAEVSVTYNECDRGFGSKDGKHRLVSRTHEIPVYVERAL